jgi:hypothetical protein
MAQPYGADSPAAAVAAEPRRTAITARAAMPYRFSAKSAPSAPQRHGRLDGNQLEDSAFRESTKLCDQNPLCPRQEPGG